MATKTTGMSTTATAAVAVAVASAVGVGVYYYATRKSSGTGGKKTARGRTSVTTPVVAPSRPPKEADDGIFGGVSDLIGLISNGADAYSAVSGLFS